MLVLFIWFVYPVAATIAIVVLGILNAKYKSEIRELKEEKDAMPPVMRPERVALPVFESAGTLETEKLETVAPEAGMPEAGASETGTPEAERPVTGSPIRERKKRQLHPGLASLVIGVVFVVIAGLIFATTNWYLIPDLCKVAMVFGGAVLFFFASRVAERRLKIERTGRAFYILGSIFLFLTVLAIGYFKVLGPGFVLEGSGRWWVLWAGSVVTESAFLLGFHKYKERVFTWVYLAGLTVSMTFLMAALRNYGAGFIDGMLCYGVVLLLVGWMDGRDKKKEKDGSGFLPEHVSAAWNVFAAVNFALFAGLRVPGVLMGFYSVCGGSWLEVYRITLWDIFCTGLMAAGMAVLALIYPERRGGKILYRLMVAVSLQYAAMGILAELGILAATGNSLAVAIPAAMEYRYLLAAALHGGWFALAGKKRNCLWTETGDVISTVAVAGNAGVLLFMAMWRMPVLSAQLTASAAILILAGMTVSWSRKYPGMRRVILYLLGMLTVTGYGICICAGMTEMRYHYLLFGYLVLAAIWDIVKKDSFWADILLVGSVPQVVSMFLSIKTAPFFLFLALYLFIKTWGQEGKLGRFLCKASCICSLAGIYMELYWRLPNRVLAMLAVVVLLAAEYLVAGKRDGQWRKDKFWNVTGSAVFVALMVEFYRSGGVSTGYLAVCLGLFFLVYGKLYLENSMFAHLPMAVAMLPLPWHMAWVYGLTDGQVLGGTAVAVLVSGILFRLGGPVHVADEEGKNTLRVDWYHILIGPVLVILAGVGGRGWESLYTLLLVLYVLQFAMNAPLKKAAVTAAMALGIWFWWRQPFIPVPGIISLESNLLPVAAAAAVLPKIWGDGREARGVRTAVHACCLALLAVAAFASGEVWDALMLELICLLTFLAAGRAENRFWKNLSGSVLVLVALYMTKGFWLSLSWWVYLLAAGIGLIAFAAWNEMNKKE